MINYPNAFDLNMVGKYPAMTKAGGGYVWDEVLEYRVWCHPKDGAEDLADGNVYCFSYATYQEAKAYSDTTKGAEDPLALVLQREYLDEPEQGKFIHVKEERMAEWLVQFLSRPKRTEGTIPDFLASDAPSNRLDIIRGLV